METVLASVSPTRLLEALSMVLGLAYALLAVRRMRWCWVAGGLSSAILVYLAINARLPMQAALQSYYVLMGVYGFWRWSRQRNETTQRVSTWPLRAHLASCAVILVVSLLSARWLSAETQAAWPFLDSVTTWTGLLATWLVARMKLENWLYWIAIDAVLVFLFAAQDLYLIAALYAAYLVIAVNGFLSWQRVLRSQGAHATAAS